MSIEKLHNKYFWGAVTVILFLVSYSTFDPFFKDLIDISLVISVTALIMKVYGIEPWRGGNCFNGSHLEGK